MSWKTGAGMRGRIDAEPRRRLRFGAFTGVGLLLVVAACNGGERFESRARTGDITIDAAATEWRDAITYFEEQHAGVGFMNDGDALYLFFSTQDPGTLNQVLAGGLTLWFDPAGKNERRFGIRYPRGVDEDSRRDFFRPLRDGGSPDSLAAAFGALGPEMELIDVPGEPGRIVSVGTDGVEAAAKVAGGELIAEMRVPLVEFAAVAGNVVSVGMEAGFGMRRGGGRGSGEGPGGMGGMPHGPGGHEGGFPGDRPPEARGDRPQPLNLWLSVELSKSNAPD